MEDIEKSNREKTKYKKIYHGKYDADYKNIPYSNHSFITSYCVSHDIIDLYYDHRYCKKIQIRIFQDEYQLIVENHHSVPDNMWDKIITREI